jgi:hypothetical protein
MVSAAELSRPSTVDRFALAASVTDAGSFANLTFSPGVFASQPAWWLDGLQLLLTVPSDGLTAVMAIKFNYSLRDPRNATKLLDKISGEIEKRYNQECAGSWTENDEAKMRAELVYPECARWLDNEFKTNEGGYLARHAFALECASQAELAYHATLIDDSDDPATAHTDALLDALQVFSEHYLKIEQIKPSGDAIRLLFNDVNPIVVAVRNKHFSDCYEKVVRDVAITKYLPALEKRSAFSLAVSATYNQDSAITQTQGILAADVRTGAGSGVFALTINTRYTFVSLRTGQGLDGVSPYNQVGGIGLGIACRHHLPGDDPSRGLELGFEGLYQFCAAGECAKSDVLAGYQYKPHLGFGPYLAWYLTKEVSGQVSFKWKAVDGRFQDAIAGLTIGYSFDTYKPRKID